VSVKRSEIIISEVLRLRLKIRSRLTVSEKLKTKNTDEIK